MSLLRTTLRTSRLARPLARPFSASVPKMSNPTAIIPADVVPLTEEHKAAVLATAPVLAEHGVKVTTQMYKTMLGNNPALRDIFSHSAQTTGAQPLALAQSVYGYAANINDLTPLVPVVVRIAEKHAALGVKPEHYATVAENLIKALQTVLGDAFTPELQTAWYHAYWQLAKIFIEAEANLYSIGHWQGFKEFEIVSRHDESGTISSFEFVPKDKSQLPLQKYKPGQFVTIRVWVDELGCYQNRHYTLSDAPQADKYRVSIKREDGGADVPAGLVSSRVHALKVGDTIQVAFPVGSFVLPETLPKNIVLFSGGVGITPNLSILNTVTQSADGPNVSWIQGVRNANEHVFKKHVDDLVASTGGKVQAQAYYSQVDAVEGEGLHQGHVDVAALSPEALALADKDALYYVCGPAGFMHSVQEGLVARGVDPKRINIEAFHAGDA
ncbi:hypothetical protein Q8F55_007232 [Vanrija albida]|uniref:nitric oxide dioxygenase n=1 Tax=Vanrija albida TaxID=181172 RepID=A0ABR3Q029_9TREE